MGSPETFPPPKCINCGAKPRKAFGRVIDMEPTSEIEKNPSPHTRQTTSDLGNNYRIKQT